MGQTEASRSACPVSYPHLLAGFVYAGFAIYMAAGWREGWRNRALLIASVLCALWGIAGLAFALTGQAIFLAGSLLADHFRIGGWYFFRLVLLYPESAERRRLPNRLLWMGSVALVLFGVGIAAQIMVALGISFYIPPQRLALFDSLAMTVFLLVLIEQLFRNVAPDGRWSIKPLCLGLGGAAVFDLCLLDTARWV